MKRFLIMFVALGLVAGSVATAEAAKRPRRVERTVERTYECNPFGVWPPVCGWNQISVETRATETFFSAKVTDAHGQPLYVEVYEGARSFWDDVYDGVGEDPADRFVGSFCGETSEPIAFDRGTYALTFSIVMGAPPMSCPAGRFATTGTIGVTLSNLP
jgi:hypothetical protein